MKTSKKSASKKIAIKKEMKKVVKPAQKAAPVPTPKVTQFKVQPMGDRVLIKEDTESKEETTASGIIIPISAQEDKGGKRGKVVAVGNGRFDDGVHIPVSVKPGDKVLFQWGDKIKVDNEEYFIVRESEILAVIH